jgi:hypothetical protein
MNELRYGHVMLMTDQDHDGSHIKGLFMNFLHRFWPALLHNGFLQQFVTPIVKVRKTGRTPAGKVYPSVVKPSGVNPSVVSPSVVNPSIVNPSAVNSFVVTLSVVNPSVLYHRL